MSNFDGNEGSVIPLSTAEDMTQRYQEWPADSKPVFNGQFFGKNKLKELIDDCGSEYVGIRIYNSIDDNDTPGFVIVGVKADQNDMYENKILASGPNCPSCCASASPLCPNP